MTMQVRVNKGGRPPMTERTWSHPFGSFTETPIKAMEWLLLNGGSLSTSCEHDNLKADRATVVAAARRLGMKIKTDWQDSPVAGMPGILTIREVVDEPA